MNIYVASSWKNPHQPKVVELLRALGQVVYDFKNPQTSFSWADIDPNWKTWTPSQYRDALQHPLAQQGFQSDIDALRGCDTCVLVLPSGRSASWEFGYAMGQGKRAAVLQIDPGEPELMYREAFIATSMQELVDWAAVHDLARTGGQCVRAYAHDCQCAACRKKPAHNTRGWEP